MLIARPLKVQVQILESSFVLFMLSRLQSPGIHTCFVPQQQCSAPKRLDRLLLTPVLAHVVVRHISSPGGLTSHWQLATPRADFSNRHLPQNLTLILKP
jgi:hypothetical protein